MDQPDPPEVPDPLAELAAKVQELIDAHNELARQFNALEAKVLAKEKNDGQDAAPDGLDL